MGVVVVVTVEAGGRGGVGVRVGAPNIIRVGVI